MSPVHNEVQIRSGTTAEWAASDAPVLGAGEFGFNLTNGQIKVGDGSTAYASLPTLTPKSVGRATLVTGAKVVSDTEIGANDNVLLSIQSLGTVTAPKPIAVTARTPGTSFTITSSDATDTSIVAYAIYGA